MIGVAVALLLTAQQPDSARRYWPVTVDELARGRVRHTHVVVTGRVRRVHRERDGDLHVKLTGQRLYIVLECIPRLPCDPPTVGERIRAWGIARYDFEHQWWELHPLERWERVAG